MNCVEVSSLVNSVKNDNLNVIKSMPLKQMNLF